jgi:hypothetical protein
MLDRTAPVENRVADQSEVTEKKKEKVQMGRMSMWKSSKVGAEREH